MCNKKLVLITLLLVGLVAIFGYGQTEEEITVTVEIRNSDCSRVSISRFLFQKDGKPLGVKRFVPPKPVRRNQIANFSFNLSSKPTKLVLSGGEDGDEFTYRFDLNWGEQERNTECGKITVKVPYKGGLKYPVARYDWSPKEPGVGERVELDGSKSVGDIQYYGWDFDGDGNVDQWNEQPEIFYSWDEPGQYEVTLTVETGSGETAKASKTIEVTGFPPPEPSGLPQVDSFRCRQHGYLSRNRDRRSYLTEAQDPPHDDCWGHYRSHIYPLERIFDYPVGVSRITARVTGGVSELDSMEKGFELQILREPGGNWEQIAEFAAPCASGGKGTLVQWAKKSGNPEEITAVRIAAPANDNGLFVDNSALWVEYYPLK